MRLAQRFRPYTVNKTKRANKVKRGKQISATVSLLKTLNADAKESK